MRGPIDDPLFTKIVGFFADSPVSYPWRGFVTDVLWPALPDEKLWRIKAKVIWLLRLEVLWIDTPFELTPEVPVGYAGSEAAHSQPWTIRLNGEWTVERWEAERDELREWLRREQSIERFGHPEERAKLRRPKRRRVSQAEYRAVLADAERMRREATARDAGWMPPVWYGKGRRRNP